jgi:RNA 2',3'-cyclic 3'-phosphodiesterase
VTEATGSYLRESDAVLFDVPAANAARPPFHAEPSRNASLRDPSSLRFHAEFVVNRSNLIDPFALRLPFRKNPSLMTDSSRLIRTFIACAVPCPPPLAHLLKHLGQLGSAVKATGPRDLHCTLRFLGDASPELCTRLGPALAAIAGAAPKITGTLHGMGAFPNSDRPNVIWAGLVAPELAGLQQAIEMLAREFGFVPENRQYHPHVTLARVKRRPPPRLAELLQQNVETTWGTMEVTAVELFQSTLTPAGSRYDVLVRAELKG